MNDIHDSFRRQGLVRAKNDRILGGVCAGLGRRFGIDPWPARLLFVLILMLVPGSQILIYPVLWILMPSEEVSLAKAGTATPGTATPGTATPGTATPGTATPGTAPPAPAA